MKKILYPNDAKKRQYMGNGQHPTGVLNPASVFGELFLDRPARSKDPWSEPHGNLVPIVRYHDWRKESGAFFFNSPQTIFIFLRIVCST